MASLDAASPDAASPDAASLDAASLVAAVAADPSLLGDEEVRARHERLLARASVCSYCGVGCSYSVEDDRRGREVVVPLSDLGLCVKGKTSLLTGGEAQRVPRLASRGLPDDRIRAPMVRGSDGQLHEVGWDEALDRAAWLLLHVREWVGPQGLAVYGNGQQTLESIFVASLYKLVFRLSTMGANSEHCLASAGGGHELVFGNEASFTWQGFEELSRCDVAVLHGTNAFVTFPQAYEKLERNTQAWKVVIDPVRTDTVSALQEADPRTLHIRFRQGGDVLFNLAVARVVLEEGWQDHEFLARVVDRESLEQLRALCDQPRCALEAAARELALPGQDPGELAATIAHYAALIARPDLEGRRPRVAMVSSMGINQSSGSYGFATNLNLLLLTGNVGRPGAGSLRIAGQSNATSELMLGFNARRLPFNLDPTEPAHRRALATALQLPEANIPPRAGTPVAGMAEDDRIHFVLFLGTQMTRNMPRLGQWKRRLGRTFNVVIDPFLGDGVAEHADVLLPALTYVERTGVIQRGDRTLQLQQPIATPPPLARSDEEILVGLAMAIARRLRDPETAAIHGVDPEVVERTFGRYYQAEPAEPQASAAEGGRRVDASRVFDHMVWLSQQLDVYCRLEDGQGRPLSHARLREHAGRGVQWGGNGRYVDEVREGTGFPGVRQGLRRAARLCRPPDDFLAEIGARPPAGTLWLISGRGRPGVHARANRGRFNSGIKTLPIAGARAPGLEHEYVVQLHPETAQALHLPPGEPVRLWGEHGAVVAGLETNDRVPRHTASMDFVPGELNRLTNHVRADRFTHQSFIKRTAVRLGALRPAERAQWPRPHASALAEAIAVLRIDWLHTYGDEQGWLREQRQLGPAGVASRWLPSAQLWTPASPYDEQVGEAAGAVAVFLQGFTRDAAYRQAAGLELRRLRGADRDALLQLLLPLLRRLDHEADLPALLSALVGEVRLRDADGTVTTVDLVSAHRGAVFELKDEIGAMQLLVGLQRALVALFGPEIQAGGSVPREHLAFVSGVAHPCADDVVAHLLGVSPAELHRSQQLGARIIGDGAMMVVDTRRGKAVRVDVPGGVPPRDLELAHLRACVSVRYPQQGATADEHRRYSDRLAELLVDHVRHAEVAIGVHGPVAIDWAEAHRTLGSAPPHRAGLCDALVERRASAGLLHSLWVLGVLEADELTVVRSRLDEVCDVPVARSRRHGHGRLHSAAHEQAAPVRVTAPYPAPFPMVLPFADHRASGSHPAV